MDERNGGERLRFREAYPRRMITYDGRHSLTQLTRNHARETKRGKKIYNKMLAMNFTRRTILHICFGPSFSFRGRFHLFSDEYSMCHFATKYTS